VGGNAPEVEKVLETSINTSYYRLCLVVTTTCAKWWKSSPTLSAIPLACIGLRAQNSRVVIYVCEACALELLQLRIFCFRLLQDGDAGVGGFPEGQEILVGGLGFGLVS
jgi:hypothetical protein